MPSLHAHKQAFDKDGFVAIPGFLQDMEVEILSNEISRYLQQVAPRLPPGEVFYEDKNLPESAKQLQRMFQYDGWFKQFFFREEFTKLAEALLGRAAVGKNLQWFNKPPRTGGPTPPHQDGHYFMLEPNEAVTMWLALDHVDSENGCVRYVRGSHKCGMRPHAKTEIVGFSQGITDYGRSDKEMEVEMPAKPGDLLVHHALTIHRADANSSNKMRRALGFIYYSDRAVEDTGRHSRYQQEIRDQWVSQGKL